MTRRRGFILVLVTLVVGGLLVFIGEIDHGVSLSSVLEIWSDVLRDADQFGFRLTRVSDREEMRVGNELAGRVKGWWHEDPARERYVGVVGQALLAHIHRKGIPYEFHVLESRQVNAFALPGGQIFVMTGMLEFLRSEAELAAVLGHEISHVDLRHCIERFQYELALKKVGARELGALAEIARRLLTSGYNKYQELDADAHGVRLSLLAGYDPEAGAVVFNRLKERSREPPPPRAQTALGEITQAMEQAMESYFRSHPTSDERARQLDRLVATNRRRLVGETFYVGVENYRRQIPRTQQEFPDERRRF